MAERQVFKWEGTPTDSFEAPWSGWYLVEFSGGGTINCRTKVPDPIPNRQRDPRHWRIFGAPPAGYAVASAAVTFERALVLQPGGWAQSGALPLPATCLLEVWLEAHETLYSSAAMGLVQFLGGATSEPCEATVRWRWIAT